MTIMKFKLQKPSLSQGFSKVLGGAIAMCSQDLKFCKISKSKKFKSQLLKTFVSALLCGMTLEGSSVFLISKGRACIFFVYNGTYLCG